jgi:molybdopterin-guanine dinucleotide biosynthesis protein A
MKTDVLSRLERFLLAGNSKVGAWHTKLKTIEVDFDDDAAFSNINTLQELRNTPPR